MTYLVHRHEFTIEWGDCDPAGIVFNGNFFRFFDTSTWLLFEIGLGVNRSAIAGKFGIVGFPLVDVRARFVKPARYGDFVEIASGIGEFRRSSFDVQHRLTFAGDLLAEGQETRVWAASEPDNPGKIRAAPIPPEVIDGFKAS